MSALRRLMPLKISTYVVHEVFVPTVIGFVTYTFLLLLRAIFVILEQVLVRGVSAKDAGMLILLSLPHVVVLTLPMSFLFGVLLGIGRMNGENEIVALQAGGMSLRRLLIPVLALGLVLGACNAYLTLRIMPRANQELLGLKVKLFTSAKNLGEIEPKIFYEIIPGTLLYVRNISRQTGIWKGVLLFQRGKDAEQSLVVAKSGQLVQGPEDTAGRGTSPSGASKTDTTGNAPWLLLNGVVTHQLNERKPQLFRVNVNESQLVRLVPEREGGEVHYSGGMRARTTAELMKLVRAPVPSAPKKAARSSFGPSPAQTRRLAVVELQKRLAIPAACLIFGLIGFPLAMRSRSESRGRGFLVSIGVILAYYVLLNHGELLSRDGHIPAWLGVWIPNILVGGAGIVLLRKSGLWIGERFRGDGWIRRHLKAASRWISGRVEERRAKKHGTVTVERVTGSIPIALQRRKVFVAFPSLLDRYLVSQLFLPLALVLSSTSLLYIVVDFADKIDELAKHRASLGVFLAYYWNLIPQVILDVTPLALMIAVLLLFVVLERRMELTAMKAGGISLYRVMIPVLVVASIAAVGLALLQESIVPRSNREAKVLLDKIKGRHGSRSFMGTERQWLFSRDGSTLYNLLRYDAKSRTVYRFSLYRFDADGDLRFILFADRARYDNGGWIADSGWFRQIFPDGTDNFQKITSPMELDVPEAPRYFSNETRSPAEMSFGELHRYIHELEVSGYRPIQLIVHLYQKITYPLSAFIMVFLALPFGLNRSGGRRVSPMHGIAWGLGLGMLYFFLVAVFGKLGAANAIPPVLGAWMPLLLAGLFAANRLTTIRT